MRFSDFYLQEAKNSNFDAKVFTKIVPELWNLYLETIHNKETPRGKEIETMVKNTPSELLTDGSNTLEGYGTEWVKNFIKAYKEYSIHKLQQTAYSKNLSTSEKWKEFIGSEGEDEDKTAKSNFISVDGASHKFFFYKQGGTMAGSSTKLSSQRALFYSALYLMSGKKDILNVKETDALLKLMQKGFKEIKTSAFGVDDLKDLQTGGKYIEKNKSFVLPKGDKEGVNAVIKRVRTAMYKAGLEINPDENAPIDDTLFKTYYKTVMSNSQVQGKNEKTSFNLKGDYDPDTATYSPYTTKKLDTKIKNGVINSEQKDAYLYNSMVKASADVIKHDATINKAKEIIQSYFSDNQQFHAYVVLEALTGMVKFGEDSEHSANFINVVNAASGDSAIRPLNINFCADIIKSGRYEVDFSWKPQASTASGQFVTRTRDKDMEVGTSLDKDPTFSNEETLTDSVMNELYNQFLTETTTLEEGIFDRAKQWFSWLSAKIKDWFTKGFKFVLEQLGITDVPCVTVRIPGTLFDSLTKS